MPGALQMLVQGRNAQHQQNVRVPNHTGERPQCLETGRLNDHTLTEMHVKAVRSDDQTPVRHAILRARLGANSWQRGRFPV